MKGPKDSNCARDFPQGDAVADGRTRGGNFLPDRVPFFRLRPLG